MSTDTWPTDPDPRPLDERLDALEAPKLRGRGPDEVQLAQPGESPIDRVRRQIHNQGVQLRARNAERAAQDGRLL